MASIELTAARPLWGSIRDLVSRAQFDGHNVKIWESSGFFTRDFVIKGEHESLLRFMRIFDEYQEQVTKDA